MAGAFTGTPQHPPRSKADTGVYTIARSWSWKFGLCCVFSALVVPALLQKALSAALRHSWFSLTVCDDGICFRLCLSCLCKVNSQTWARQKASWSSASLSIPLAQRNSESIFVTTKYMCVCAMSRLKSEDPVRQGAHFYALSRWGKILEFIKYC